MEHQFIALRVVQVERASFGAGFFIEQIERPIEQRRQIRLRGRLSGTLNHVQDTLNAQIVHWRVTPSAPL